MSLIKFKIIDTPEEAKAVWELFSPHKTLDDEWDFRYIWTKAFNFPFYFLVGYDNNKPIGLLPLQLNTGKGFGSKYLNMNEPFLEFFGGIDIDDACVWVLPGYGKYIADFFKEIHSPAVLTYLKEPYIVGNNEATHYSDRFELNLKNYKDFDDYLNENFSGKSRRRLLDRLNKIKKSYIIEIKEGSITELELLFQFNIARFGDQSSFTIPERRDALKNFLKRFNVDLFALYLDGKVRAVSYAILLNKTYINLSMGYDISIRDISKLLFVTKMQRAIKKGCTKFDAGKGDHGWKSHFKLKRIPQYILKLNC